MRVGHRLSNQIGGWLYRQRRSILVLLIYVCLTVVMTWPIAGRLGTHIPGSAGDAWVHMWTFDWVKQSLSNGNSPFFTDLLFHPNGVSLLFHNFAWVNIAAWLPLQVIVDPGTAYSLVFLATFVMNGFCTYLLTRHLTRSETAGFVGGLVGGFWPYLLSHHNHPNLVSIYWVPLALFFLQRLLESGRRQEMVLASLSLAFAGLASWHLVIMSGYLIGLFLLYGFATEPAYRTFQSIRRLLLVGLLAGLIMAPLLAPLLIGQFTREHPEDLFVDEEVLQTDLLGYFLPSRYHPLWGETVFKLYDNFVVNKVFVPFIGYTTLALVVCGVVANWQKSRFWLLGMVVYVLLALGPELRVNGNIYALPMPYNWMGGEPLTKIIRRPDRFNLLLGVPVAVLASLGVAALCRTRRFRARPSLVMLVISLMILSEYVVSYPTFSLAIPHWYEQLAQEPGNFGVLGIPMRPRARADKEYMFYQLAHGKPLVEGHVSRPPKRAFEFIESVPFLNQVRLDERPSSEIVNISHQLGLLATGDVRYLVLHKLFLTAEDLAYWKKWLVIPPFHEDADVVVYRTNPILDRDFELTHDLVVDVNGRTEVGLIQATSVPTTTARQIRIDVGWSSEVGSDRDYDVCLNLLNGGDESVQSYCETLVPTWPTRSWQADEIVSANYTLQVSSTLDTGTYTLAMGLVDSISGQMAGRPAVVGTLHLEPRVAANVTWENKIFLPDYDLSFWSGDTDWLRVTVDWHVLQEMDTFYKTFLHLVDVETEALVAQVDLAPRNWTYPTNTWKSGESIEDTMLLLLDDVPSGQYELWLGFYDPSSGERMSAFSVDERQIADNRVLLTIFHK